MVCIRLDGRPRRPPPELTERLAPLSVAAPRHSFTIRRRHRRAPVAAQEPAWIPKPRSRPRASRRSPLPARRLGGEGRADRAGLRVAVVVGGDHRQAGRASRALNRQADRFEAAVDSGRVAGGRRPGGRRRPAPGPAAHAAGGAARVAGGARQGPARRRRSADSQAAFLMQRIDRVLDSLIARESQRVEDGLGSLAIVATASPFIGLFGTVWGIMHAFQAIAIEKNTNLSVVAPVDRPGPVRHRHRPGRRHPGLHRLQQVLHRRRQVHRPPGGLRRRSRRPPSSGALAERSA